MAKPTRLASEQRYAGTALVPAYTRGPRPYLAPGKERGSKQLDGETIVPWSHLWYNPDWYFANFDADGGRSLGIAGRALPPARERPMADLLSGQTIAQYQVLAELGRGQHAVVYKAWQASLGRHVALKVLHHYSDSTFQKLQAEARLTAYLLQQGVPNVRQLYEVGQTDDGTPFVALEYVDDSLRSTLQRARQQNQRINPVAAARLLEPVAQALDAIHGLGWVHLDLKPQNILIARGGRAVLADFGIAQRAGSRTHACTPAYASPEQAAGDRPVGPWSDIYSLGAVLYEVVAGHPPVRGDNDMVLLRQHLEVTPPSPRRVNPLLTLGQEKAIFKALAKSRQKRYSRATDLIQVMLQSDAAAVPKSLSSRRRPTLRLLLMLGTLAVLIALLALAAWALWSQLPSGLAEPKAAGTTGATAPASLPASPSSLATGAQTPRPTTTPTATTLPTATLASTATRAVQPVTTVSLNDSETQTSTPELPGSAP